MDPNQQLARIQAQLSALQQAQQILLNPQPAPPPQQLPVAAEPQGQEALLLKLYDEFVNTDEGKQLAANLAKFARFAQSKAAKS